jgi:hypothetical protein
MTDLLVPAQPGALPLFIPLAQAGVPQPVLVALDPAVRAIIETGYNRTGDPSQQVRFALLPPPSALATDSQKVAAGFAETAQALPGAVLASLPSAPALPSVTSRRTTSPAPSPSLQTAATKTASQPPAVQSLSLQQPDVVTKPTDTSDSDVAQQTSSRRTSPALDVSLPQRKSATSQPGPTNSGIAGSTARGAKPNLSSTDSGGSDSPNPGNALQNAAANVKKAIGSRSPGSSKSTTKDSDSTGTNTSDTATGRRR